MEASRARMTTALTATDEMTVNLDATLACCFMLHNDLRSPLRNALSLKTTFIGH